MYTFLLRYSQMLLIGYYRTRYIFDNFVYLYVYTFYYVCHFYTFAYWIESDFQIECNAFLSVTKSLVYPKQVTLINTIIILCILLIIFFYFLQQFVNMTTNNGYDQNDMHVPRGTSVSNEYVYFIVMFIETKMRTGACTLICKCVMYNGICAKILLYIVFFFHLKDKEDAWDHHHGYISDKT